MANKTIVIRVNVNEPEEISPGIFETRLTHDKLEGGFILVHSEKMGSELVNSIIEPGIDPVKDMLEIANAVVGVYKK